MKLDLEKFKIIPSTYNGIDFMKIQYEDKDLVMKLKGGIFHHRCKKLWFTSGIHSR